MKPDGVWKTLIVAVIVFTLSVSLLPAGMSRINDISEAAVPVPEPDLVVGGDLIVSYDEPGTLNDALHPSVAYAPAGSPNDGTIHVVWDEFDEIGGFREIMYSMSDDGGITWDHDLDDFVISDNRKGKANSGDAVNPTISIDHNGWIHVVWSERQLDGTWEVMYSRSEDNGKTWTGQDTGDIMVSHRYGDRLDADIMSTPEITVGHVTGKATEILHVVWSERDDKYTQEEIRYSRSFDSGNNWTGLETDDYISKPDGTFASDPSITTTGAEANYIHVTWKQVGPYGFDEIWYSTSDHFGDKDTWTPEDMISAAQNDGVDVTDVSLCGDINGNLYSVWKQFPHEKTRAPLTEIYYSFSDNNGQSWSGVEKDSSISFEDGYEPFAPKISMSDKVVQVVWTEVDENSPQGTTEIHTSWSDTPTDPQSWTGSKEDIVLSNGDDWGPANAHNVSFQYANLKGKWQPVYVWDELNDRPSSKDRADRNTEIHTDPIEWTLTVSTSGSGSVTKNPNQSSYADGTNVQLTANPSAGWSFDHWSGDLSGSTNPVTITMDSDKSVIAYFVQNLYKDLDAISVSGPASCTEGDTIGISRSFQNIGTDTSGAFRYGLYLSTNNIISTGDTLIYSYTFASGLAAGASSSGTINVGLSWGLTGTYYYGLIVDDLGQVIESDEGNNWVASSGTVTISAAQFTLGISTVGNGTVTKNPNQATYGYGDTVQLTANPDFGWEFDYWGGDLSSAINPDTITMDSNKIVTAYFTQITYDIALTSGWNLISIPLQQADTTITTVLSSINGNYDMVKYYDITDSADHWKTYSPSKPGSLNDLTGIDHTMAIWIHITTPCTFSPTGEYAASTTINLYTGWNFVGYPTQNSNKTITQALTGTNYDSVEGYDAADPYLLRTMAGTELMTPGDGYWIHVPADTIWTVDW